MPVPTDSSLIEDRLEEHISELRQDLDDVKTHLSSDWLATIRDYGKIQVSNS